ncbi:MAG: GNAT family N-acetyltransferase [Candidatus Aenigmatarchaeota archaeon]
MRIEVHLARKPDKRAFVRLALERDAGLQDVSSCYKPYRKAIGNPEYWGRKFDKLIKEKRLLLACIDGKLLGLLHFTLDFIDYPAAYVELVFVSKINRNLGIARQLFSEAEKMAAAEGYSKIFSSTNPSNRISLNMHKAFGYRRCGSIYGIETPTSREIFVFKNLQRPKKR